MLQLETLSGFATPLKAIIIFFLLLLPTKAFPEQAVQKDIVRVPAGELKPLNSQLIEQFQWDVRGTTPADTESLERLRAFTQSFLGSSLGISALSVAEAIAIPGFFSGSLVASAIILAPLAITLSLVEHKQYETIQRALQETSLLELTRLIFYSCKKTIQRYQGNKACQKNVGTT